MPPPVVGLGALLGGDDTEAIELAKQYFSYRPGSWQSRPPSYDASEAGRPFTRDLVPVEESIGFDIHDVIDALLDSETFFEVKPAYAPELVTGFGLLAGQVVGIVANQPA